MAFVIIDLEFNNLSGIHKCYPNIYDKIPELKHLGLINEIIEIGAIKVDMYMKPIAEFKTYIKPTVIPIINPNILNITGIKEENLENGLSFNDAMDKLVAIIDKGDIICSWAKDDIIEIIRNSNYHNYNWFKWFKEYLDIQEYVTKILGYKKSISLGNALKQLRIKYDQNKLHDALNDAKYELEVFKTLYNSRAVQRYIISDIFDMPVLEIKTLTSMKIDYDRVKQLCPRCNKKLKVEYSYKVVGWRFISLGICEKCNNKVLNELVIKNSLHGDEVYTESSSIISEIEYSRYEKRMKTKNK